MVQHARALESQFISNKDEKFMGHVGYEKRLIESPDMPHR